MEKEIIKANYQYSQTHLLMLICIILPKKTISMTKTQQYFSTTTKLLQPPNVKHAYKSKTIYKHQKYLKKKNTKTTFFFFKLWVDFNIRGSCSSDLANYEVKFNLAHAKRFLIDFTALTFSRVLANLKAFDRVPLLRSLVSMSSCWGSKQAKNLSCKHLNVVNQSHKYFFINFFKLNHSSLATTPRHSMNGSDWFNMMFKGSEYVIRNINF